MFICGAAKSATTSLWNYLTQHPAVYDSGQKEPGYFSALRPLDDPEKYESLYGGAHSDKILVDASSAYLTSPDSAQRIREACPGAKIIFILRNPADRAHSLYRHMVWHGFEYASTFERALQLEEERVSRRNFLFENPEYYYNFLYFRSGLYGGQISRYTDIFHEKNILLIRFRDFVNKTSEWIKSIYRFIGVDHSFNPDKKIYNSGGGHDVWSPWFHYFINRKVRHPLTDYGIPGRALFSALVRANRKRAKKKITPKTKKKIIKKYEKDIYYLERITQIKFANFWCEK